MLQERIQAFHSTRAQRVPERPARRQRCFGYAHGVVDFLLRGDRYLGAVPAYLALATPEQKKFNSSPTTGKFACAAVLISAVCAANLPVARATAYIDGTFLTMIRTTRLSAGEHYGTTDRYSMGTRKASVRGRTAGAERDRSSLVARSAGRRAMGHHARRALARSSCRISANADLLQQLAGLAKVRGLDADCRVSWTGGLCVPGRTYGPRQGRALGTPARSLSAPGIATVQTDTRAIDAIGAGDRTYTQVNEMRPLREAVAAKFRRKNDLDVRN